MHLFHALISCTYFMHLFHALISCTYFMHLHATLFSEPRKKHGNRTPSVLCHSMYCVRAVCSCSTLSASTCFFCFAALMRQKSRACSCIPSGRSCSYMERVCCFIVSCSVLLFKTSESGVVDKPHAVSSCLMLKLSLI